MHLRRPHAHGDGELQRNKSDYDRLRLLENKTQFSLKKMRELFLPIEKSSTPTAYVPAASTFRGAKIYAADLRTL